MKTGGPPQQLGASPPPPGPGLEPPLGRSQYNTAITENDHISDTNLDEKLHHNLGGGGRQSFSFGGALPPLSLAGYGSARVHVQYK